MPSLVAVVSSSTPCCNFTNCSKVFCWVSYGIFDLGFMDDFDWASFASTFHCRIGVICGLIKQSVEE